VVTLALAFDIDAIAASGLIAKDWQKRLPHNSAPYTSTIVFLVRKGNPKGIRDWGRPGQARHPGHHPQPQDLRRRALELPRCLGLGPEAARGNEAKAKAFVTQLFKNVPVLDSGARGSTTTFVQRGIGDVLLAWENEAFLSIKELAPTRWTSSSLRSPSWRSRPLRWSTRPSTRGARAPWRRPISSSLYSPEGQELAAKHYYRPRLPAVAKKHAAIFPKVNLITIDEEFGGWQKAQKVHFVDGAIFDQIYLPQ